MVEMGSVVRRRSAELYYCILLYRRFLISNLLAKGKPCAQGLRDDWQNAILRYSRLKICATPPG
jgi:hypothetical protein